MHRTEGANNTRDSAGRLIFKDGPPGTTVPSDWLNAVQEEIARAIESQGIQLYGAAGDIYGQLAAAMRAAAGTPVGCVIAWPFASPPTGWLECDGSAISRTTYTNLFAVSSTNYGVGDGSTTFNIPDYRGEFLRGYAHGSTNDPDKASRTNRGDGTTGDNVGTKQLDAFQAHKRSVKINGANKWMSGEANVGSGANGSETSTVQPTSVTASYWYTEEYFADGSSGTPRTTSESRGRNVGVMFIIKY